MTDRVLSIWTIYDRPSDYPTKFVARRWVINDEGNHPTSEILTDDNIDGLRAELTRRGLKGITRSPDDDPNIVEKWL